MLASQGLIVNIGQVGPCLARALDRRARSGELVRYRGYWNAPLGGAGIGPLKTIWARADVVAAAGIAA